MAKNLNFFLENQGGKKKEAAGDRTGILNNKLSQCGGMWVVCGFYRFTELRNRKFAILASRMSGPSPLPLCVPEHPWTAVTEEIPSLD